MEDFWHKKNVLVTGGAGLVGSHVVEKLLKFGAKVFVLDIVLQPGAYFTSEKLEQQSVLLMQDVRNLPKLKEVVLQNKISYIFHLAAQALVPLAFEVPYLTLDTNIMGTVNVLEVVRENPQVKGVVVASSDKAYGKACKDAREDQPLAGDHPYDVSKSAADLITQAYFKTYGLPVAVSRFANIFGPGDLNFDRLIPGIMKSVIKDEILEIRSDGQFVRDYMYVKDVADGYVRLAEKIESVKGQAFNFSAGLNFSVLDIIKTMEKTLNTQIQYKILNNQRNEIPYQSLNYEKANKVLGWKAAFKLEDAIQESYTWYKKYFNEGTF